MVNSLVILPIRVDCIKGKGADRMGFLDLLGEFAGKMAAKAEEFESLRREYEHMDNNELISNYKDLKGRSGDDCQRRRKVVYMILKERGVIKDN